VVVSDWGGTHDTYESIHKGLDMEFGTWTNGLNWSASNAYDNYYLANPYLQLLRDGQEDERLLNDKVRRILRLIFRTNRAKEQHWGSFGTEKHALAGRKIAQEGIVLLQNKQNILPLNWEKAKKITIVGENAIKMMTIGGGSSSLKARYEISPLQGLQERAGNAVEIVYARGYTSGEAVKQDGLSSKEIADNRSPEELIAEACRLAQGADYVIFIGGLNKNKYQDSEGDDRENMDLPYGQNELISALSKINSQLVVVLLTGNAVAMPWVNEAAAIVEAWYSGSEAGTAIASILVGDINPSGKLPFTFPVFLSDNSAHALGGYPGDGKDVSYNEDIYMGYRWHDKQKIKPLFAFGHGLSYTRFEYGKPSLNKSVINKDETIHISIPVKNTGEKEGAEVVQLYIKDEKSSLPRPEKELKGFEKIFLKAGEEKTVTFSINAGMLAFYDDKQAEWITESGKFELLIGASSSDIRQKISFLLQ
jgi:beta-glucosidase